MLELHDDFDDADAPRSPGQNPPEAPRWDQIPEAPLVEYERDDHRPILPPPGTDIDEITRKPRIDYGPN